MNMEIEGLMDMDGFLGENISFEMGVPINFGKKLKEIMSMDKNMMEERNGL